MKNPAAKPAAAASKPSEANSEIFADLLQARMLDEEKARLRDVKVDGDIVVYEFTNGERVTVDRKKIPADVAELQKYVAECFLARKPT